MTEQDVDAVMRDIRMLSPEAKLFFVKDMAKEDPTIVGYPVVKRWITRNHAFVAERAPELLTSR